MLMCSYVHLKFMFAVNVSLALTDNKKTVGERSVCPPQLQSVTLPLICLCKQTLSTEDQCGHFIFSTLEDTDLICLIQDC